MKKIVAVNASPRTQWNTGTLVRAAAEGASSEGAEVKVFDLAKADNFTGCTSCFACKLPTQAGKCIYRDGLTDILEEIRNADGLILGSPNYLGDVTAGFRALYERLIFQYITYKTEPQSYNKHHIPVLFIMTSNAAEAFYPHIGYDRMLNNYQNTLSNIIGPTKIMICSDTLQVEDYSKYNWTIFDPQAKQERHDRVFPDEKKKAFSLGADMVKNPWEA